MSTHGWVEAEFVVLRKAAAGGGGSGDRVTHDARRLRVAPTSCAMLPHSGNPWAAAGHGTARVARQLAAGHRQRPWLLHKTVDRCLMRRSWMNAGIAWPARVCRNAGPRLAPQGLPTPLIANHHACIDPGSLDGTDEPAQRAPARPLALQGCRAAIGGRPHLGELL